MLLASLFVSMMSVLQVDTVLSRLTALKERIEGTEALIEIDLDHRRNELVAFDLVGLIQSYAQIPIILHAVWR